MCFKQPQNKADEHWIYPRIVQTRLSEPLEGKGELIKVVYYFLVAMVAAVCDVKGPIIVVLVLLVISPLLFAQPVWKNLGRTQCMSSAAQLLMTCNVVAKKEASLRKRLKFIVLFSKLDVNSLLVCTFYFRTEEVEIPRYVIILVHH